MEKLIIKTSLIKAGKRILLFLLLTILCCNIFYRFLNINFSDELCVLYLFFLYIKYYKSIPQNVKNVIKNIFFTIIFYIIYSLIIKSNSINAILFDAFQQMKPYLSFYIIYGLNFSFSKRQKEFVNKISFFLLVLVYLTYILFRDEFWKFNDPYYYASIFCLCMLFYLTSKNRYRDIILLILLSFGLLSLKSKFIGFFVCSCCIIILIKKRMHFNFKYILYFSFVLIIILFSVKEKFNKYYVEGIQDNPTELLARPILYKTGISILVDYFPFGSGLGSFATEASRMNYSKIYHEYNISKVFGLTEEKGNYITDTYFPVLAEFGFIGIIMFIYFIYFIIKTNNKNNTSGYGINIYYKSTLCVLVFILIESTSDSTLLSSRGVPIMMILAIVLNGKKILENDYRRN